MQPIRSNSAQAFVYYGEREGWLIALSQHRDSEALDRSNFAVISADLRGRFPDDVAIESTSHFLVGWVEYLLVSPDNADAVAAAEAWRDRLADYPVADEMNLSEIEYAEEWCVRCDGGTRDEHPTGRCGKFRSEDDARELAYRWQSR